MDKITAIFVSCGTFFSVLFAQGIDTQHSEGTFFYMPSVALAGVVAFMFKLYNSLQNERIKELKEMLEKEEKKNKNCKCKNKESNQ